MFKDYKKFLSITMIVYSLLLSMIFILKLLGLDCFGIDINDPILKSIDNFINEYGLKNVWYSITIIFDSIMMWSIIFKDNSHKSKIFGIITSIGIIGIKFIPDINIQLVVNIAYYLIIIFISNLFMKNKISIKRFIYVNAIMLLYQLISLFIRNVNYQNNGSFIVSIILSLDYFLLMFTTYAIYFGKGENICQVDVFGFLPKKLQLKNLLQKLHINFQASNEAKLAQVIYFLLSFILETTSLLVILFISKLNGTIIECVFMLISFIISKKLIGKEFHLKSISLCFLVSNITYYILNRITISISVSFFISILLGVGLAYFTSKLVRDKDRSLYVGMSESKFDELVLNVIDKDSLDYKICKDYFVNRKSQQQLAIKYNYGYDNIQKIKQKVKKKIK